jgi:hypothetical protein
MAKRIQTPRSRGANGRRPASESGTFSQGRWNEIAPYALISLVCFVLGLGVLVVLIGYADKLVALGLAGNLYYIVLLPLALAAAGFLFGVLRSYARYRGEHFGGALELGGPIVGAALVVVGGFWLVPKTLPFPLTAYVHGEGGPHDVVLKNSGYVVLDLGPDRRREPIHENGQAYFPSIPVNFRDQEVATWVESDAYEPTNPDQKHRLDGPSLYLAVRKKPGRISGRVHDEQGSPVAGATIHVAGLSTVSDSAGQFGFIIPGDRLQPELDLDAVASGYSSSHLKVVPNANEVVVPLTRAP